VCVCVCVCVCARCVCAGVCVCVCVCVCVAYDDVLYLNTQTHRYDKNADLSDNIDSPRDRVEFLKNAAQILVCVCVCVCVCVYV